ncbi:MAG: CDP-alcohol phosphatidyltransferase family protein [Spirochaetaceae bacterium]|jgi:phosphatidylglycerophosphate synthase|nr:CDP-alcohol phosphatidyltransferase family protein [Spirochaetaceae bacterium]
MAFRNRDGLINSIWKTLGLYSAGEFVLFLIITLIYSFPVLYFCLFLAVQTAFHLIIAGYLLCHRDFFFVIDTKTPLTVINTANKISLFRITMVPVLLFLILGYPRYPVLPALIPLLILTFLSDLADGFVSRKNHERTFIGQILDSSSDYLAVGLVAIFYYGLRLLPGWLFILILGRLLFNPLGMLILFLTHKKLEPTTTVWGKITIASLMILLVLEVLRLAVPRIGGICFYIEVAAGGILGFSLIDKGIYFIKNFTRRRED